MAPTSTTTSTIPDVSSKDENTVITVADKNKKNEKLKGNFYDSFNNPWLMSILDTEVRIVIFEKSVHVLRNGSNQSRNHF
jgi:hypothetical protein